jgi:diamine N-acetyltransferase
MFKGTKIYLRGIELDDLSILAEIENNPGNWQVSGTLIPFSYSSLKDYVLSARDLPSDKQVRFIICENKTNLPIGFVDLFDFDPIHHRAGIGILINEAHRKKGIATEALNLMIDYAFGFLNLHQIWANILQNNHHSIRLFTKSGFELSGTKKEWNLNRGKWIDEGFYQLLNPNSAI